METLKLYLQQREDMLERERNIILDCLAFYSQVIITSNEKTELPINKHIKIS